MSAELDYTNAQTVNNRAVANMFTVKQTAWHRDGHVLTTAPRDIDAALTLINGNYTVEKRPVTYTRTDGTTAESKLAFLTYRTDTDTELGSVGPIYQCVQGRDAMHATLSPMIDAGVLTLETGGVLREGADMWLLGKFNLSAFGPNAQEVFGSEVEPYALVKVNHSGRRNNEIALTMIRVVCANTLGMVEGEIDGGHGESKSASVRHTGDATQKMIEGAEKVFGGLVAKCELVAKSYKMMKETQLTPSQFRALVLVPALGVHPTRRKGWNPEAKQADTVVNRYEKKGAEIVRLWTEGDGHTGNGSAWEAYNGLVQAVDHDSDMFPTKSGVYRSAQLMHGYLRDMKDAASVELVKFAEEVDENTRLGTTGDLADVLAATEERGRLALAK
jgi:phage/plasmid-like protein (TIGR03299 family)